VIFEVAEEQAVLKENGIVADIVLYSFKASGLNPISEP
jgi:hypothetical protein